MTVSYSIVGDSKGKTLTVIFSDGSVHQVADSHPNFVRIQDYLITSDDLDETRIRENLDLILKAGTQLTALSERVSVAGNRILFDGDNIDESLSNHILRLIEAQDEDGWGALVNFLEKINTNPSESSRNSLYAWLRDRDFAITREGDFIAYKGVAVNSDGVSVSISHGTATVDGVVHVGAIPNGNGSVITMPRSDVNSDTNIGCSTGLHAGTWEYASGFARGRVLTVKINPRDVVSVPEDCNFQKLRVCRYEVIDETEVQYVGTTYTYDEDDDFVEISSEDGVDFWGDDEPDEDTEYEDWEDAWSHDIDQEIRERFDVEVGVYPEDLVNVLTDDYYWDYDAAVEAVYGPEDEPEPEPEPEDAPVPVHDFLGPVRLRYTDGDPAQ